MVIDRCQFDRAWTLLKSTCGQTARAPGKFSPGIRLGMRKRVMEMMTTTTVTHTTCAADCGQVDLCEELDDRRLVRVRVWAFDRERVDPVLVHRLCVCTRKFISIDPCHR